MTRGFTLIELLVVILVVGILSAVALPQYQVAVEKARSAEALTNLRAIVQGMQLYKLANGTVTQKLDDLDLALNGTKIDEQTVELKNFTYNIRNFGGGTEGFEVVAMRNNATSDMMKYYVYFGYWGEMICVAKKRAAEPICRAICGGPMGPLSDTVSNCSF